MLILGLTLLTNRSLMAQNSLNAEHKTQAIDSICQLLREQYVFPEVATQMEARLGAQLKAHAYDELTDPEAFAEKITADLRSVSQDKHLRVRYDPDWINRSRNTRSEEDRARQRAENLTFSQARNFGFEKVALLEGNIGYLKLNGFSGMPEAGETAVAAMQFLAHAEALIIDLRENGGGSPRMIQILSTYLFSSDEPRHLNSFYWRPTQETTQTWTLPYLPGPRFVDVPVYVLTSERTFSAAEEFTYNLKNMERATIVGETTGGGAHPGGALPANALFVVWVPQGRAINPITGTNWEGTGISPHIAVPQEKALETALEEIRH